VTAPAASDSSDSASSPASMLGSLRSSAVLSVSGLSSALSFESDSLALSSSPAQPLPSPSPLRSLRFNH